LHESTTVHPLRTRLTNIFDACISEAIIASEHYVQGRALYDLVMCPALLAAVGHLLGESFIYHGATCRPMLPAACKGAARTSQPFHQDSQYFDSGEGGRVDAVQPGEPPSTRDMHIVSAWLPLCDVDERNGCLRFLPGSQACSPCPAVNAIVAHPCTFSVKNH
jgi:ectoine hydroxylase-related dioxygenase (phytanoyl-CoA dioxygenase family)